MSSCYREFNDNSSLFHFFRLLGDNEITIIKSDGLIGRLPNLHKLDLKRNSVVKIEENAFEGSSKLHELYVCLYFVFFYFLIIFLFRSSSSEPYFIFMSGNPFVIIVHRSGYTRWRRILSLTLFSSFKPFTVKMAPKIPILFPSFARHVFLSLPPSLTPS